MNFLPEKRGNRLMINVTSLIDVMFLVLIFFLGTTTFKSMPAINLVLPRAATAEEAPVTPVVVYLSADGRTFLNDKEVSEEDLGKSLEQMHAASAEDRVILQADERATHGDVVHLIDLVKESGYTRVSLSARKAR